MIPSSLLPIYLEKLSHHFGVSAPLLPDIPKLALGDYGYYVQGQFFKRGNLLEEYSIVPEYVKISEPDLWSTQFLCSVSAEGPAVQGRVSHNGQLYTRVSLAFDREPGFFLHLRGVRNELFFPDKEIESLIQYLVKTNRWDEEYRLVWQRFICDETRFGYVGSAGGKVQFMASKEWIFSGFKDCELLPELEGCSNAYLDLWLRPFECAPAANFTRVRSSFESSMGEVDGFKQDELYSMGAGSLVLDNGFSEL